VTEAYEVKGRRLGVRWSRGGLDAELRALAAGALGVQAAPANISVVLGERTGRTRSKHQVHIQGHLSSLISEDGGLIRAVIRALGALASGSPVGSLSLDAFLVLDPGRVAVAVDRRLAADVRGLEPQLRRRGRRVLELPRLDVLPDSGRAVLPDGAAAIGVSLEALDARWPLESGDDDLVAGELPITRFVYAGHPDAPSRADATAEMVPMVRDQTGRVSRAVVAQLAALTGHVRVSGVLPGDRGRLAGTLGLA